MGDLATQLKQRTDEDLIETTRHLRDYTDEARDMIRAELVRRGLGEFAPAPRASAKKEGDRPRMVITHGGIGLPEAGLSDATPWWEKTLPLPLRLVFVGALLLDVACGVVKETGGRSEILEVAGAIATLGALVAWISYAIYKGPPPRS